MSIRPEMHRIAQANGYAVAANRDNSVWTIQRHDGNRWYTIAHLQNDRAKLESRLSGFGVNSKTIEALLAGL